MKNCPFCKAEIEENARFCLYCMTSLDDKEVYNSKTAKKKYIPVIIIIALITIASIFFVVLGLEESNKDEKNTITTTQSESTIDEPTIANNSYSPTESTDTINNSTESTVTNNSEPTSNSTEPTTVNNNESTHQNTTKPTETPNTNKEPDNIVSTTESAKPSPTPSDNNIYNYRDAVPADDYMSNQSITKNAVVITSVKGIAPNGIYEIPEEIDNKKVVAIMDYAFCDANISNTVKQIIIPSSVKTINAYAFYNCYNLTDIYIKGEAVACPSIFLPEKENRNYTITIHCSKTCNDRNFRTYKTLCTYLETVYKEWNG